MGLRTFATREKTAKWFEQKRWGGKRKKKIKKFFPTADRKERKAEQAEEKKVRN